jgi:hypothetical protein
MTRRLEELDRLDARQNGALAAEPPRSRRWVPGLVYLTVMAVVAGFVYFGPLHSLLPGDDGLREPNLDGPGTHAFLQTTPSGRPVGYDTCLPIRYTVNPDGAPEQGMALIEQAVQAVSAASGMRFEYAGPSGARPAGDVEFIDGERPPPVLIAWATVAEYPGFGDKADGVGGSTSIAPNGPESARYVTGQVILERDRMAEILESRGGDTRVRMIIAHELGHMLGLEHVEDDNELMAPIYTGLTGFGPGDRIGLGMLGSGPCWQISDNGPGAS